MVFGIIIVSVIFIALVFVISIVSFKSQKKMFNSVKNEVYKNIQNAQMDNLDKDDDFENLKNITKHTQTSVTTKTFVNGEEVESLPENISGILDNVKDIIKSAGFGNSNNEIPKEEFITCEYCGTENQAKKRKCSSCGASLKSKK